MAAGRYQVSSLRVLLKRATTAVETFWNFEVDQNNDNFCVSNRLRAAWARSGTGGVMSSPCRTSLAFATVVARQFVSSAYHAAVAFAVTVDFPLSSRKRGNRYHIVPGRRYVPPTTNSHFAPRLARVGVRRMMALAGRRRLEVRQNLVDGFGSTSALGYCCNSTLLLLKREKTTSKVFYHIMPGSQLVGLEADGNCFTARTTTRTLCRFRVLPFCVRILRVKEYLV